jgi:hypothetical protein
MTPRDIPTSSSTEDLDNKTVITMEKHSTGGQSPAYSLTRKWKDCLHGIENVKAT